MAVSHSFSPTRRFTVSQMGEPEDLASAKAVIDELRREKEKCEAEVASVRSKLHGAVRKGKAIEVERTNLAKQLEALKQKLESSVQVMF